MDEFTINQIEKIIGKGWKEFNERTSVDHHRDSMHWRDVVIKIEMILVAKKRQEEILSEIVRIRSLE